MTSSWFHKLFGFAEDTNSMARVKDRFAFDRASGRLTSQGNNQTFEAGNFETPSLKELRESVNLDEAREKFPGSLTVREVVSDVSLLHDDRANQFALFQAASQFNCLEFPSSHGKPENGITCYAGDRTQGPACAIACAPGTVVRTYFAFDGSEAQSASHQVENLKEVEDFLDNARQGYIQVVAGYTMSSDDKLMRLSNKLEESGVREKCKELLRIGFQWDTCVTNTKFGNVQCTGPLQLVSQAYCSACSVSYSRGSAASWEAFASMVLEASYEATMYGAVLNALKHNGEAGSKKVYLTAVGGGVFGNDTKWIASAMQQAFAKVQGIGLEVIIVSYGRPEPEFRALLQEPGK
jgi:hypothetical protein